MALPDNDLFNYDPYSVDKPAGVQPRQGLQRRYNPGGQAGDYGSGYNPGGQPASYGAAFADAPAAPVRAVSALNPKQGMQRRAPEPVFIDPTDPASFTNSPPNRGLRRRANLIVPAGPESVVAETSNANLALGLRRRASGPVGIGADINPMSNQGELMRRLEISQNSFKGSPQARRLAAEAILGQLQDDRTSRLAVQEAGDRADLTGQRAALDAAEGFADRKLRADMFNTEVTENREALKRKGQITPKDMIELQIASANAQREADKYELSRPDILDRQAERQIEGLRRRGVPEDQIPVEVAVRLNQAGLNPDDSITGSAGKQDALNRVANLFDEWQPIAGAFDDADNTTLFGGAIDRNKLRDPNAFDVKPTGMLRRFLTDKDYEISTTDAASGARLKRYTSDKSLVDNLRGLRRRSE